MARQAAEKKDFTFIGGLNTEAGFLTFPDNAWVDGDNIIPEVDGAVVRRVKLDFENDSELSPTFSSGAKQTQAFTVHRWEAVGGNGSLNYLVVQSGTTIRFYDTSNASVSPGRKSFTIDLTSVRVPSSPNVFGTQPISVAYGNGNLVIVSTDTDPILVKYVAASDTITVSEMTLKIRDFYGVVDGLAVNGNPATLSAEHNYNLLNQGWDSTKINAYFASQATYPSNAQIWTAGKDASDNFDPALLVKQDFGSSAAPKGRYILDVFSRNRTAVSGVSSLTTETENARPQAVAFFAGRAWYAGINSSTIGSWVLFSRVTDTDEKYYQCYQEADPTAEHISDLIPSDGGVIPIPEAGSILKLVPLQESLIVFAENGIWQILGDTTAGFRADGYQVKKLTSFGVAGAGSIVEFENTVAFWSPSGAFFLVKDPNTGDFIPQSLTLNKIQSLYTSISGQSKRFAQGFYDSEDKKIVWMYNSVPNEDNTTDRFKKNKFLIFDVRLQSFYTHTIASLASNSPELLGGIVSINPGIAQVNFNVTEVDQDQVITTGSDTVIITVDAINNSARIPKYLTVTPSGSEFAITFSDFENLEDAPDKFRDWFSKDGVGAETSTLPYLVTGYQTLQSGTKVMQAPYILTYMKRTETGVDADGSGINESGALLQGRWEWTDHEVANRWSVSEQVYRRRQQWTPASLPISTYVDGYPLVVAKSKLRGKGHALNLKYSCESGKDMQLCGWSIIYNVNVQV